MILDKTKVGIIAYGTSIPQLVIQSEEIEQAQNKQNSGIPQSLGVLQKTVPDIDEDTITLSTTAAFQALQRWNQDSSQIGALFIGSESHPYAVKPSGTVVKQALGLSDKLAMADLQFACKAGTQSLQIVASYVASGMIPVGLAIGADTAQSKPGDVLEFTAGAGAAAFVLGKQRLLARLIATASIATDTPDFWRRPGQPFPEHAGRFSGQPAYYAHVSQATKMLLREVKLEPAEIDWCVFHTPNAKFPKIVASKLGFTSDQLAPSLVVKKIGNTYAAASLLGLAAVLDQAKAGQKILVTSYGSGSGSDSFLFETTKELVSQRKKWKNLVQDQISIVNSVSYSTYSNNTKSTH